MLFADRSPSQPVQPVRPLLKTLDGCIALLILSSVKAFISWSGDYSKALAEAIAEFLRDVVQAFKPWVSSEHIRLGNRWLIDLADELDQTNFGILCVTSDNFTAPWLNFEAGALGKKVKQPETGVVGLLFDVQPVDLTGPLTQFQNAVFSRETMLRLLTEMNKRLSDPLEPDRLERSFENGWTRFQSKIDQAKAFHSNRREPEPKSERALLIEAVELLRNLNARIPSETWVNQIDDLVKFQAGRHRTTSEIVAKLIGMARHELIEGLLTGSLDYSDVIHLLVDNDIEAQAGPMVTSLEAEIEAIKTRSRREQVGGS